jgi:Ni2+-binding GTPase involved in maturation of urease and hydrogenase
MGRVLLGAPASGKTDMISRATTDLILASFSVIAASCLSPAVAAIIIWMTWRGSGTAA